MVLLKLYWSFLLIGFSSFGGLSMIPQISDQVITNGWMTVSQVTDILSIAEMTPGPFGLNCATFAGIQAAGIPGAVVANLGILTPTFTLGTLVAVFFFRYKDNRMMEKLLTGIRPACLGMVFGVLLSIMRSIYITETSINIWSIIIGLLDFILLWKLKQVFQRLLYLVPVWERCCLEFFPWSDRMKLRNWLISKRQCIINPVVLTRRMISKQ